MELRIKNTIADEINNNLQQNFSNTVEEINQKIKEMKLEIDMPKLEPEFFAQFRKLSEIYRESTNQFASSFIESIKPNLIFPASEMFLRIAFQNIDWSNLTKGLKIKLDNYEKILMMYDSELWTIDEDLFNAIERNASLPSFENIEYHVEANLDDYIEYFQKENMYKKYVSLLNQSYSAYKSEQYALSAFPLFAIIEGVISSSFNDYEIDHVSKPALRRKRHKLYNKLADFVETTEDELAINTLFFRRVFYVYKEIFSPSWNRHPDQINRNWIMHGSYNYDQISKTDVLKLFQLIKAAEVLKYITLSSTNANSI